MMQNDGVKILMDDAGVDRDFMLVFSKPAPGIPSLPSKVNAFASRANFPAAPSPVNRRRMYWSPELLNRLRLNVYMSLSYPLMRKPRSDICASAKQDEI